MPALWAAPRPVLGVRVHLVLLALLALLPAWGLAGVTAWRFAEAERARLIGTGQDAARGIATAMSREAAALRASLAALATSPALRAGDAAAFARQITLLPVLPGRSIHLEMPAAGTQAPPGDAAALPALEPAPGADDPAVAAASGLEDPPGATVPGAAVVRFSQAVPGAAGGAARLVLATDAVRFWSAVIERAQLPPGWVGSVLDQHDAILARHPQPARFVGQPVHPDVRAALAAAPAEAGAGWVTGSTRDGVPVHVAWRRVEGLPWTVLVGVPREAVDGALRRTMLPVILAGVPILLLLTAATALWASARLARPLRALEAAAIASGRGAVPAVPPPSGVREIDAAGRALVAAAAERRDREAEIGALAGRLGAVLESTTDCVLVLDRGWRPTYLNGRARTALGAAAAGAAARAAPLRERLSAILGTEIASACRQAIATGLPVAASGRAGDGSGRWFGADAFPAGEGLTVFFRDLTAERAAAAALRASEARLQAVLDHVPVGVVLAEAPSGRMVLTNRRLAAMLAVPDVHADGVADYANYPAFDALGRLVAPAERPIARALAGAEEASAELRFRCGDGRMVWMRVRAAPIRDAEGAVVGAVAALAETEAERAAEAALRESELRFRTLAEAMPQIVWTGGPDGRVDYLNPRFFEFAVGGDAGAGAGAGPQAVAPHALAFPIHPDDRRATALAWRRALAHGAPYEAEYRLRRADGAWRWFVARALPIRDAEGSVRRWVGAANDVTELVETRRALERQVAAEAAARHAAVSAAEALAASEARFRGFAEASPDVLWILDPQADRLHYVSPAYARLWGEPPPAPGAAGLAALTAGLQPEEADAAQAATRRLRAGEVVDIEYRVRRADGEPRWVRLMGFPIPGRPDAPGPRVGGFARDVTQRREAETRQGLLVAELNHRVKNTLATVLSLARQTARREGAAPPAAGMAADAAGAGTAGFLEDFQARLMALARGHDLLTATIWRGATMHEVAAASLLPWRGPAAAAAIDPRMTVAGPSVWLAPRQALGLALAIHELATNAAKHGALREPAGRVALDWQHDPAGGGWITLRWTESGGPPVRQPSRRGFGTRLLQAGLAAELGPGAEVTLDYPPEGFRAMMRFRTDGETA